MTKPICSLDECEKPVAARGWCNAHYLRWRNHGDPLGGRPSPKVLRVIGLPDGRRVCTSCEQALPLDDFDQDLSGSQGRRSHCRQCRSQKMKTWYQANRDRQSGRQADRREKWPERIRQQDAERYERHREMRIEMATEFAHLRRARLSEVPSDRSVTRANLRRQYGDSCFYCNVAMTFKRGRRGPPRPLELATIDHVTPICQGGSHTWDNTILACWRCNIAKSGRTVAEWEAARERPSTSEALRLRDTKNLHAPTSQTGAANS